MRGKLGSEMALPLQASRMQQAGGDPRVSGGQRCCPPAWAGGAGASKVFSGKTNIILKVLMVADRHVQSPLGSHVAVNFCFG